MECPPSTLVVVCLSRSINADLRSLRNDYDSFKLGITFSSLQFVLCLLHTLPLPAPPVELHQPCKTHQPCYATLCKPLFKVSTARVVQDGAGMRVVQHRSGPLLANFLLGLPRSCSWCCTDDKLTTAMLHSAGALANGS